MMNEKKQKNSKRNNERHSISLVNYKKTLDWNSIVITCIICITLIIIVFILSNNSYNHDKLLYGVLP